METIRRFSEFLNNVGTVNFLAIGIAIMVAWLLISGLKRGLKKRRKDGESEGNDETG